MAKKKSIFTSNLDSSEEKAICYIRVSTEEQATMGDSLDAQEKKVKAYCLLNNLEIVEIIREEGVSASKDLYSRPGGARILELVKKKQVGHIVATKLDRLFRDTGNMLNQVKEWDKAGVAMHLIDNGGQSLNTSTAMGKHFLINMASFAEFERNQTSERTTQVLNYKKQQRKVYSPTPYGYDRKDDLLVINKTEQKTLEQIRNWHAQGWSLRQIASELTKKKVPTKRGGKWYACTVSYLLNNDLYKSS